MAPPGMKLPQYTAAITASLAVMAAGSCIAWPSPVLKMLEEPDAPFRLLPSEGSWIVSLKNLGNIIAPIPSGWLMGRIGRKTTLLASSIPFIISWILVLLFETAPLLYCARILGGLGVGMAFTVSPIYLGEIADVEVRGALGTLLQGMMYCGILLEYCVGPFVSYYTLGFVSAAVPLIFGLTFMWMPESPYWLLQRGRREDARSALAWLRRTNEDAVNAELGEMSRALEIQQQSCKDETSFVDIISARGPRRALIIVITLQVLKELSGNSAVIAYAAPTLAKETGSGNTDMYVIILGLSMFLSTMACSQMVDHAGRRPLLLTSCGLSSAALSIAALYFFLKYMGFEVLDDLTWMPVFGLIAYGIAFSLGLSPIPAALLGELFPAHVKGLAACSAAISLSVASLVVTKLYQVIAAWKGVHVVYWAFAASCVGGAAFVAVFVPETKRKTFQEIQDELNGEVYQDEKKNQDIPLKSVA